MEQQQEQKEFFTTGDLARLLTAFPSNTPIYVGGGPLRQLFCQIASAETAPASRLGVEPAGRRVLLLLLDEDAY